MGSGQLSISYHNYHVTRVEKEPDFQKLLLSAVKLKLYVSVISVISI